ncbi:MAG: cytidylate kinase-like family protein [Eubacterium sp.]
MNERTIITIARQFGSGGRNIGQKLAKALEIPFYDQELIDEGAKESGINREMVKDLEESPTNSLLYSIASSSLFGTGHFSPTIDLPITDRLFLAQSDIIRNFADKGSCVIVGRCANYVLRDAYDTIDVFIHRDFDERVNQVSKLYDLTMKKAEETVKKIDKKRSSYYSYYTDKRWGQAENYDLCLNSGLLGEDSTVEIIKAFIDKRKLRKKTRG